ncbi:MAG: hypothetical protein ACTHLY_17550 [Pseudolabrys sp.]
MTAQPGILAIWHDCRPGRMAEFEHWFQSEHLLERLEVPGFLYGRRHQAVSGSPGFFNFYLTDSPAVLVSPAYRDRLDHPTPMTRTIMSEIFINMSRTVCVRSVRRGRFRGAYAVTVRAADIADLAGAEGWLEEMTQRDAVASGEIWTAADTAGQPASVEETLRGGDRKIGACLMLETLREADATALADTLAGRYPRTDIGIYRVLCQIGRGDL